MTEGSYYGAFLGHQMNKMHLSYCYYFLFCYLFSMYLNRMVKASILQQSFCFRPFQYSP